jgi:putative membrane protein
MRPVFIWPALAALGLAALVPAMAQAPNRPPMTPPHRPPPATSPGAPPAPAPANPAPVMPSPGPAPGAAAPEARPHPHEGAMMPLPHQASSPDQVFLIEALRTGMGETDLAFLAEQKAGGEPVRDFARQMIRDHGQTNNGLNRLTEGAPAAGQPDAEHRRIRDALSNLNGPEFDIEYLRQQVQAHQRMALLLQYEIGSGADAQVKRFASGALPKVFAHLATARQLLDQASMQNPQAAAAPPRKASGMPTPQTPRATPN